VDKNAQVMVVLSLGTNLGDRHANMEQMEWELRRLLAGELRFSPLYETAPIGVVGNHLPYLNRIVAGQFFGTADELLVATEMIETALGRTGKGKMTSRTADVDILLFGSEVIHKENLKIPHHALFDRKFEIEGVQAVVPEMTIPGLEMSFAEYVIRDDVKTQELSIIR